ncbi:MAG: trehalose-6-phosphate synthase [Steroidobacteraceae bacterium]
MFRSLILRFAIPALVVVAATALIAMPYVERMFSDWFRSDVELRAGLVMDSMGESLDRLVGTPKSPELRTTLARVTQDRRLIAVLICGIDGSKIHATQQVPREVDCDQARASESQVSGTVATTTGSVYVSRFERRPLDAQPYRIFLIHDLSFLDSRRGRMRQYTMALGAVGGVLLVGLAVFVAWLILRRWTATLLKDIKSLRFLDEVRGVESSSPVLSQVRKVLQDIEQNQRLEIDYRENWTPEALTHVVQERLGSPQMLVVSNREPYLHMRAPDGSISVQVPASGMVTALEPVIRACSGTWIAHGSGDADRDVVDSKDRVAVPPDNPSYTLRRVWLTEEEETGYYYGFSNEGMWPLCHLAYVRPAFRQEDWQQYQKVNAKFADVVEREARSERPIVFIQDFHFALLPALIRERRPGATIMMFWHIPWPNAETFGVCPWREELLRGLLMSDVLGFHTRYHCQNFLATVDRFIECQIDHEHMTITTQGHVCHVAPYPISIEWPPRWLAGLPDIATCRREVRQRHGIGEQTHIALGVERWDFTKGIVERFHALEKLLDQYPSWRGRVSLLQVAAPTRARLPAYQVIQRDTYAEIERINARFATTDWKPIVLIDTHQAPKQVFELYRAADLCLVNSLHDGMNLVAKEFVAARDDDEGVLVLSTFAGASRELVEALLVNPYDIGQTAEALRLALEMPMEERRERMRLMRRTVKENNVYRWAGIMLMDAQRVRQRQRLIRGTRTLLPSGGARI